MCSRIALLLVWAMSEFISGISSTYSKATKLHNQRKSSLLLFYLVDKAIAFQVQHATAAPGVALASLSPTPSNHISSWRLAGWTTRERTQACGLECSGTPAPSVDDAMLDATVLWSTSARTLATSPSSVRCVLDALETPQIWTSIYGLMVWE